MAQPTGVDDQQWRRDGLRFTCTACGDCCAGDPGYVWLNKAEIAAMAELRGQTVDRFEAENVIEVGVRKSLAERADGDCVMLDAETRRCTVYSARPRQCRTWPFWDSNLKSPEAWAEACQACPGSGQGRLYAPEEIEDLRRVIRI
ncbi:YkgJ family cysteine cluster protein [Botrimarina sp.]|uniref:YkgJ family cysteine cluster protein n=1 Tax=Botrimarina sp. TaxID=2795802 RepID=UPI0032EABD33